MKKKHALLMTAMLCLAGGLNAEDMASEYCNTLVDPVATDGGEASDDASDSFYMNWSTGEDGAVTITLLTTPGNAATTFRGTGMNINNFTVDGAGGKLVHAINDEKTVITLTPTETLAEGAKIAYDGYVEYKVGDEAPLNNLYPTLHFEFTYGATCVAYHNFPTGHFGDAEFGDENGRITLTIARKSDTSVAFIINPNNIDGFIDYVEVKVSGQNPISFGEPGGDTSAASHELLVEGVTFPLTVEYIKWHTVGQVADGRWEIINLVVNESELYVPEDEPGSGTGLSHMQADNMRVIARDGLLHVTTDAPAAIRVYNLQGMCVAEAEAAELHTALPAGTYVVAANGQAVKVALR